MASISIQRCVIADADALSSLAVATFPLACLPDTTPADMDAFCREKLSSDAFRAYLRTPGCAVWIALDNTIPVGYVMSVFGEPSDPDIAGAVKSRPTTEISKLYVLDSHHGTGLASQLLATAVADALDSGAASLWLGVGQDNIRANLFYEKSGFIVVGTRKFQVGDSFESDFVREKNLHSLV